MAFIKRPYMRGKFIHILFSLGCLLLLSSTVSGQRLIWEIIDENQAHFGFVGYHGGRKNVCTDRQGNVIYAAPFGNTVHVGSQTLNANYETEITKRDKDGQLIWTKTLGGNGFKYGHSITTDSVGNIYLLGWYYGNSSINGNNLYSYGNYDCFVVKLSSSGAFQYVRTFGSSGYDYPFAIEVDVLGNAYIAGKFAFSLQAGSTTLNGLSNSHFLLKLNSSGAVTYLRNVCTNGSGDWGKGDLSAGRNGKLYLASSFQGTSTFDATTLSTTNGVSGYVAIINPLNGSIETVTKAGAEAWLIDHDFSGQALVFGLQSSSNDSLGGTRMPSLSQTNALFLARLDNSAQFISQVRYSSFASSFQTSENFRTLHVARSGQIYLSGDLINGIYTNNDSVLLRAPYNGTSTQAVLVKLEDDLSQSWFVSAGSEDTLNVPNNDFGCGVTTDLQGNVFWSTFNFANSVNNTRLFLNSDTSPAGVLSSRYKANGIHLWNLSEPYINTLNTAFLAYCPGDSVEVEFLKYGTFDLGNTFTAQLSDSAGSFSNPTILGSIVDTAAGTIKGLIPFSLLPGSNYRFRVVSDLPEIKGSQTDKIVQMRSKPIADAGPDPFFCLGDTFPLIASGGGGYLWNVDSFLISGDSALALAFPNNDRSFVVRVQDSLSSCFNFDTVYTQYRRKPKVAPLSDTLVCYKSNFYRSALLLEGDSSRVTYAWYDSLGTLLSTDSFVSMVPYQDEKIILIVWDSCSVERDTLSFYLEVRDPLKIKHITAQDTTLCKGTIFNFYPGTMGGDSLGYAWTWKDSSSTIILSQDSNFNRPINFPRHLLLSVTDGCSGLDDSIMFRVWVSEPPKIETLDSVILCSGDTAILNLTYSGGFPNQTLVSWDSQLPDTSLSYQKVFNGSSHVPVVVRDVCDLKDSANSLITVRQALALQVRQDTVVCQGDSILTYITGSESDTAFYSFFWNNESSPNNYFYTRPLFSFYSKVRIVNNCDLSEQLDSVFLQVRDSLSLLVPFDTLVCYGEQVNLQAYPNGGLNTGWAFTWLDENANVVSNTATYSANVMDSIRLEVILNDGCSSAEAKKEIFIKSSPPLSWVPQADTLLCFGQMFSIDPVLNGGKGLPISWTSSRDSSEIVNGFEATQAEQIQITASDNCSVDAILIFNINVRDSLRVDLLSDTNVCYGLTVDLNPVLFGGIPAQYQFEWQGSVSPSQLTLPNLMNDTMLGYCLTDACSKSYCDSVQVNLFPINDASFSGDTTSCVPGLFSLTADYIDPSGSSEWRWVLSTGLDTVLTQSDIDLELKKAGTYSVKLFVKDQNGCVTESGAQNLSAHPKPVAFFSVNKDQFDLDEILKVATTDKSIVAHQWSGYPGITGLNTDEFEITLSDTGTFILKLKATNAWQCTDSFSREILVKEPFNCWVPSAFLPDNIHRNNLFLPVCTDNATYTLRVFNRWGQLMYDGTEKDFGWDGTYLYSNEPAEISVYFYVLTARNNFGEVIQRKGNITLLR